MYVIKPEHEYSGTDNEETFEFTEKEAELYEKWIQQKEASGKRRE